MNKKTTKRSLLASVFALVLCVAMLVGSTFAWFTDTASTGVNKITSGKLDVKLFYLATDESTDTPTKEWQEVTKDTLLFDKDARWEPGHTEVVYLKVENAGNLALKYQLSVNVANEVAGKNANGEAIKLSDYIKMGVVDGRDGKENPYADRNDARTAVEATAKNIATYTKEDHIVAGADVQYVALVVYMPETVGNEANYVEDKVPSIDLGVKLVATQYAEEMDSFDNKYDEKATYPVTSYEDLAAAIAKGESITINEPIRADKTKTTGNDRLTIKEKTELTLGSTYTVPGSLEDSDNWAALYINNDTIINAGANGGIYCEDKTEENPTYIGGPYVAHIAAPGKTVIVNGGNFYGGGTTFNVQSGTLIVNGGFFQVAPDIGTKDYRYNLNCVDANYKNGTANIIVKGGTFVNFDPSNNAAEGAGTSYVADGYKVVPAEQANGDIWYTVVAE